MENSPSVPQTGHARRQKKIAPSIVAERAAVISALHPVVEILGCVVSPNIEIVLHDLTRPESSIVAIANGHISGRAIGHPIIAGPQDDKGFALAEKELSIRGKATHSIIDDYPTVTSTGQQLKSATAVFRDSAGEPFAALCLNCDLTVVHMAHAWLEQILQQKRAPNAAVERVPEMDVLMREIISDAVSRFNKPVTMMTRNEKIHAVNAMLQRGLFIVKGSVERAATALGVTRFTVYNYLEECKRRNGMSTKESLERNSARQRSEN